MAKRKTTKKSKPALELSAITEGMKPIPKVQHDQSGNRFAAPTESHQETRGKRKRANMVLKPGDPQLLKDETTTGQTGIIYGVPQAPLVMVTDPNVITLYKRHYTTYEKYREIRKDPTISLCRAVIAGPILAGAWSVQSAEDVDPAIVKFIGEQLIKRRYHLMETAINGCIDFGWQGYEKIFDPIEYDMTVKGEDGNIAKHNRPGVKKLMALRKLKPLLQDMTSIMTYLYSGDFAGFRQGIVFVEAPRKTVLISYRTEGTMWHGYPLLEEAKESVDKWNTVEVGADRYDKKIAGSHFVVYYPLGNSLVNGTERDNYLIACDILQSLEASGNIAMPSTLLSFVEGMENTEANQAWKLDFLSDQGARQSSFVDRLRYLDTCKARAMHIPERAIMEGQFGTKAEAEGHGDIMTVLLENLDRMITNEFNFQVVDHLLELNFGRSLVGKVWLESSPISDDKVAAARQMFYQLMANPSGFMEMFPFVDYGSLMDLIDIPKNKDVVKPNPQQQGMAMPSALQGPQPNSPMGAPVPGLSPQQLDLIQQSGLKPGQPQPLSRVLRGLGGSTARPGGQGPNLPPTNPGKPLNVPLGAAKPNGKAAPVGR